MEGEETCLYINRNIVDLCSTFAIVPLRPVLWYFSEADKRLIRILLIHLMTRSTFCSFHNECMCFYF